MRATRKTGFTLIELMIVVAIIGILAAIAIPNFLKFQCRSKQSEAKTNLSGIFTAEKSFFGEFNTYGTDLVSVNWQPDGSPLYVYGFTNTYPAGSIVGLPSYSGARNSTDDASVIAPGGGSARYNTSKMNDLVGASLTGTNLPASVALSGQSFTAGAAGDIDTDQAVSLDKWTINNTKQLQVASNDCTS
jgi:type IV pilus assembly protein PilA